MAVPAHDEAAKAAVKTENSLVGWRIERLRAVLDGPLAVVAAGQTHAAAVLWARLHEAAGQPAWAMSPYDVLQRGVPSGARVLVMSVSGRHHDVLAAARSVAGKHPTIAVTCDRSAPLVRVVRGAHDQSDAVVLPNAPAPVSVVPMLTLAARAYGGIGSWMPAFRDARPQPVPDASPRVAVCMGAGLAYAAAVDFAARCTGAGFAHARGTDIRQFAHAETAAFDPGRDWLVCAAAGEAQRTYLHRVLDTMPEGTVALTFEAERADINGALSLLAQSMVTFAALGLPANARADWATRLARLSV